MAIYDPNSNQHSDGRDSIAIQPRYYDVHCFFDRTDGYSIPVKIVSERILNDDEIIQHCIDNDLFSQEGDDAFVNYVEEIDKEDYQDMKGTKE